MSKTGWYHRSMPKQPVIVIHGGAGSKTPTGEKRARLSSSLERVISEVYRDLTRGVSAERAAVRAVELLENDDLYNAGKGSKIQSDGRIRMSAALMRGDVQKFSACLNVEGVKNPIKLARELSAQEFRVLAGAGASRFARENKLDFASPFTDRARRHFQTQKSKFGTVGAVALDSKGRLAAATSTGGRGYE
ncbi:MAG: isoaspartyl peptidase/L-asparaginase, partial [Bdellovibrionia bacterium]